MNPCVVVRVSIPTPLCLVGVVFIRGCRLWWCVQIDSWWCFLKLFLIQIINFPTPTLEWSPKTRGHCWLRPRSIRPGIRLFLHFRSFSMGLCSLSFTHFLSVYTTIIIKASRQHWFPCLSLSLSLSLSLLLSLSLSLSLSPSVHIGHQSWRVF